MLTRFKSGLGSKKDRRRGGMLRYVVTAMDHVDVGLESGLSVGMIRPGNVVMVFRVLAKQLHEKEALLEVVILIVIVIVIV